VSLEQTSVCVVDGAGRIVRKAKVASEPEALMAWFAPHGVSMTWIRLEAGPLSQWLFAAMEKAGLPVSLLEIRRVRSAFKAMTVKTDRKDTLGIAHLMRMGWFRPVHCKSLAAQEVRSLLTACKLLLSKRLDIEFSLRGALIGCGLKVGLTTPKTFAGRVRELTQGQATLEAIAEAMLKACDALIKEGKELESRLLKQSRRDKRVQLLMTTPGVGALTALTFAAAIDDAGRFSSSRMVGAYFGLTPRKYQSGETDVTGRISKVGDHVVRVAIYEAANVVLTRPVKGSALKSWAQGVAKRAGMKKTKVALARKLAVVMHQMLRSGKAFSLTGQPQAAAA
jgi:transposase